MGEDPGPLLGRGRSADVYDLGDGTVLRRNRDGSSTEGEAAIMRHVAAHGYPVPQVLEAAGPDLVMERIEGPTMLDAFARTPWKGPAWARLLAALHRRLEEIPLPEFETREWYGPSEVVLHGDLHPDNVMLTAHGPVVIDWPNAGAGARGADVANTWILLATSTIDARGVAGFAQRAGRSAFTRRFLRHAGRDRAQALLAAAGAHRLEDRNVRPEEAERIRRLVRRRARTAPSPG